MHKTIITILLSALAFYAGVREPLRGTEHATLLHLARADYSGREQAPPVVGQADYNVVPLPQKIELSDGAPFILDGSTVIVVNNSDEQMERNAQFLHDYILERMGMSLEITDKKSTPAIELALDDNAQENSYSIGVSVKNVIVTGSTAADLFYGIQTLRKSLPACDGSEGGILLPAGTIEDSPRFGWRGMLLDCARHFFPVEFVKEFIDMLALHNMNRFHWHLTDDQGWRIEIKSCPELTEIGSMRSGTVIGNNSDVDDGIPYGGYYTRDEIREVIEYAAQRYITVVPEIDMPGHASAILAAHPELGCTGGPYEVGHKWGVYNDVLCIGNEDIYTLLYKIIDEVAELFPAEYIHIGGDETPTVRWEECPKCQAVQLNEGETLQGQFTKRIESYVESKGKKIIGWDELLGQGIGDGTTIMAWRGMQAGVKAVEAGHDAILTPLTHCYFDYYQTENRNYEPSVTGMWPISVETVYSLDPCPESLSEEALGHILGVQANLWCEYITVPAAVEYMLLPRMAALAEVQWSSAAKDFEAFKARLDRHVHIYDEKGWQYALHLWPERMVTERWKIDQ